jgi:hypothetical protein
LLWGRGDQLFLPNPSVGLGFEERKIQKIMAGTARITWFSQYSGSKVQNFANIAHY